MSKTEENNNLTIILMRSSFLSRYNLTGPGKKLSLYLKFEVNNPGENWGVRGVTGGTNVTVES